MKISGRQKAIAATALVAFVALAAFLLMQRSESSARCADSFSTYYSKVLNESFCYPDSWSLIHGDDAELLPVSDRPPGYSASIHLERPAGSRARLATVSIRYVGQFDSLAGTTSTNCANPEMIKIDDRSTKVCVFEHPGPDQLSMIPADTLKALGIEIEAEPPIVIGVELFKFDEAATGVSASVIEAEAMAIVTSFREGTRP